MIVEQEMTNRVTQSIQIVDYSLLTLEQYHQYIDQHLLPPSYMLKGCRDGQHMDYWLKEAHLDKTPLGLVANKFYGLTHKPVTHKSNVRPILTIKPEYWLDHGCIFYIEDIGFYMIDKEHAFAINAINNCCYSKKPYDEQGRIITYENSYVKKVLDKWAEDNKIFE